MCHCRKCQQEKPEIEFYKATDLYLDMDGRMSVCKQCCFSIWDDFILTERTLNKTFLKICRVLNISYDTDVVDSVNKELNKAYDSDRKPANPFSLYMRRMGVILAKSSKFEKKDTVDLTFYPPVKIELSDEDKALMSFDKFWGDHYTPDEVLFLEEQYAEYQNNYDISDHSAKQLLKRLCKKHLELKAADAGEGTKNAANLEKEMIKLMDTLSISPNSTNAASANKMKSTFGVWVQEIEQYSPAEWLEQDGREMYKDVQKWDRYFKNFIQRPLQNYFSGIADEEIINEDGSVSDWGIKDDGES